MQRDKPYYSLKLVRKLVVDNCFINTKARNTARNDFGWNQNDIQKAILKLRNIHFYKSNTKYDNPSIYVDYYKAKDLMGENVYIHFRIEDEVLIICSFKEI